MNQTILAFLKSRAYGIENKASREEIVAHVRRELYAGAEVPSYAWLEREVRREIAKTPEICSIQGGYFIPRTRAEAIASYEYHYGRGLASLKRASRIRDAYPEIAQGRLF